MGWRVAPRDPSGPLAVGYGGGPVQVIAAVVPCYNEAARLDVEALGAAIEARRDWRFVFVDDGSTDATGERLEHLRALHPASMTIVRLAGNVGKGEAVRQGMVIACEAGADVVAYIDADLSTSFDELERLTDRVRSDPEVEVVLGTRVRRLGADIRRSGLRHAVGRVYATIASMALAVGVYDTQCGAKAFRRTARLDDALSRPFGERWSFDVELLSRLTRGAGPSAWAPVVEEPLLAWHTRDGSKVRKRDVLPTVAELARIAYRHRRAGR